MSTNARFLPSDSGLYLPPYWSEGTGTPGGAAGATGGRFPGAGSSTGAEATSLPRAGGRPLQRPKPAHPCPALLVAALAARCEGSACPEGVNFSPAPFPGLNY